MTDLEKARVDINQIDEQMAELFCKRMEAAKKVAEYKMKNGLPIFDPSREDILIKKNISYIENEELIPFYMGFIRSTIKVSKDYQSFLTNGMKVAIGGEPGAFADIVSHRVFPSAVSVYYPDHKSAYRSVENGECSCALLPIENSFNGDVGNVMDMLFFGKLYISGIYEAEIVQNLLGVKGSDISQIKKVISHPQALGQCAEYIENHSFETEDALSTSLAAKKVAQMGDPSIAAIGSEEAAAQFGLYNLESKINKSNVNTTRFAVLTPYKKSDDPGDERFVMLFTVKDSAGALGEAVSIIGKHKFNLRSLKSRPTKELLWNYYFYVEGEGNIGSEEGKAMLSELAEYCSTLRVVGSFKKETQV